MDFTDSKGGTDNTVLSQVHRAKAVAKLLRSFVARAEKEDCAAGWYASSNGL